MAENATAVATVLPTQFGAALQQESLREENEQLHHQIGQLIKENEQLNIRINSLEIEKSLLRGMILDQSRV